MATAPKRLSDKIKPWIVKAIKDYTTENVTWEVSVFAEPDATNDGAWFSVLVLYLEIDGPDGTWINGSPLMTPYGVTQDKISKVVVDTLNSLFEKKELRRYEIEHRDTISE
jgi:hypothetical protein